MLADPGERVVERREDRMVVSTTGRTHPSNSPAMWRPSARPDSHAVSIRALPQPSPASPMRSAPKKKGSSRDFVRTRIGPAVHLGEARLPAVQQPVGGGDHGRRWPPAGWSGGASANSGVECATSTWAPSPRRAPSSAIQLRVGSSIDEGSVERLPGALPVDREQREDRYPGPVGDRALQLGETGVEDALGLRDRAWPARRRRPAHRRPKVRASTTETGELNAGFSCGAQRQRCRPPGCVDPPWSRNARGPPWLRRSRQRSAGRTGWSSVGPAALAPVVHLGDEIGIAGREVGGAEIDEAAFDARRRHPATPTRAGRSRMTR